MGSLGKRLDALERLVGPPVVGPPDEVSEHRRTVARDILDEFARLKSSRAVRYRGGVRVEPEDIPGKILGPGYTTEQMWEVAAKRVFRREHL